MFLETTKRRPASRHPQAERSGARRMKITASPGAGTTRSAFTGTTSPGNRAVGARNGRQQRIGQPSFVIAGQPVSPPGSSLAGTARQRRVQVAPQPHTIGRVPTARPYTKVVAPQPGRPQRRPHYPASCPPVVRGAVAPRPMQTNVPGSPPAQKTILGWPSYQAAVQPLLGRQPYGASRKKAPAFSSLTVGGAGGAVVPQQRVCHSCGSPGNGCITLKGLEWNSSMLSPYHQKQLRILAQNLLRQTSNAVVVTGYTDARESGYPGRNLGEQRAMATVVELKKQLARMQPKASENLFWKTRTAPKTGPARNSGGNRRVEVCVQQL